MELTPDDSTNIDKQSQEADSALQRTGLDVKEICEKCCIYEHFMLEKKGDLVPVGEQALSKDDEYEIFYEEPGIKILLYREENPVFALISCGKDEEEAEAKKSKGFSVLKERLSEGINSSTGTEIEND